MKDYEYTIMYDGKWSQAKWRNASEALLVAYCLATASTSGTAIVHRDGKPWCDVTPVISL